MPDRQRIQNGLDFEKYIANILGGKLVPGSGNQWHSKSDVTANGLRISCKAAAKRNWSQTREQLSEAIDYTQGTGEIPVLSLEDVDGEQLIVMRLSDFARALAGDVAPIIREPSKSEMRREQAKIPVLLRE
jgi:hypothetical protein